MQHVYGNSEVTLAETGWHDTAGGLFHARKPSLISPMIICPGWEEALSKEFVLVPWKFWKDTVSKSPIISSRLGDTRTCIISLISTLERPKFFGNVGQETAAKPFLIPYPKLAGLFTTDSRTWILCR